MTEPPAYDPRHPRHHPLQVEVRGGPSRRRRLGRAFAEFLRVPLAMLAAFALFAAVTIWLDLSTLPGLAAVRRRLESAIPTDAAVELLTQVAPAVLSIASLTFSVLLVAVQQNASVYTPIVFDQFLRRRGNQVPFGFFLGLSLYAFLLLAAARPDNPLAFGAVFLLVFTMVALVMLVTLIYGTIDQMRPTSVLPYIRDAALHARYQRRALVARTRAAPTLPAEPATEVRADAFGFVADIRMAELEPVLRELGGEVEIVMQGPVGTYVSAGDVLGHVRGREAAARERTAAAVSRAVVLDQHRDVRTDPTYAMEQIAGVAWNAYSSAQHNPILGLLALRMLVDLFERWVMAPSPQDEPAVNRLPVVYPDVIVPEVIDHLTEIAFVSADSIHSQPAGEVMLAVADALPHVEPRHADRLADRVSRILPVLENHVTLPRHLERAAATLSAALRATGRPRLAADLDAAVRTRSRAR